MMNSVNRRGYKNIFEPFYAPNNLRVCKERVGTMHNKHRDNHVGMRSEEGKNAPKSGSDDGLKGGYSCSCRKIKFFAVMVDNVRRPKKVDFVSHSVIPIPNKIGG